MTSTQPSETCHMCQNCKNNTENNTDSTVVDLIYILDESGSMDSMGKEPIQSVNDFVQEQKDALDDGATFTLIKFNNKIRYVYDDVPLGDVPVFSEKEYRPSGSTALLDAIGTAIQTKKAKKRNRNVVVVIMTDGQENASQIYRSRTVIKAMVEKVEKELNWQFIYQAANQDAFENGQRMGISNCAGYAYTPEAYQCVTQTTSAAVSAYRTSAHTTGQTQQRVDLSAPARLPGRDVATAPARAVLPSRPYQSTAAPSRPYVPRHIPVKSGSDSD